jgi:putative flippase GtrA
MSEWLVGVEGAPASVKSVELLSPHPKPSSQWERVAEGQRSDATADATTVRCGGRVKSRLPAKTGSSAARSRSVQSSWLRYSTVSLLGVAVNTGVLTLGVQVLGMHYLPATLLAVEVAVLHNFIWHWKWTWRHRGNEPGVGVYRSLLKFHAGNGLVSVAGTAAGMWVFAGLLGLPILAANLSSIASCYAANFLVADRFVFAR